ncbi:D-2-hydroxyacid dehydrogenase family protein [Mucilaginibacter corticis]|uniref:D-2-hydroxyacid dehydrogenase family protein n=2 Tax=Mucilaginibacter corticis TaxID=2597670 RepID=A0A556MMI1_9SPHI|nr:D-2-hydroxyacid dehydrogenase family protein [Mucilaginibacter corticis]
MRIAILDDYQNVALKFADWSAIETRAELMVFNQPVKHIEELADFDVLCIMRERMPLNRAALEQLHKLKLIVSTGARNASLDSVACKELGIEVRFTEYHDSGAPEMTWALLMALARHIPTENTNMRTGGWQTTIGTDLKGKTIGIVGLGRVGSKIARYAKAFEMKVIAWSENLTEEKAHRAGAELVSKERLFKSADFVTLHLVLSERTRHIVGTDEFALMKKSAYFINTSRGPLVKEDALIAALKNNTIAGAALDVYDQEPLASDYPLRTLPNVVLTPHTGYVTEETYKIFYGDTVKAINEWLSQR